MGIFEHRKPPPETLAIVDESIDEIRPMETDADGDDDQEEYHSRDHELPSRRSNRPGFMGDWLSLLSSLDSNVTKVMQHSQKFHKATATMPV